ncbi:hypothetical protein [Flavicella sediminum]|uniref:hypothetical protein n=1 Tax=Flavicella sediminum TaxID=2585141 RepID=UPI001120468B|nr:hypothetical protein [Flavicella sediminum]
MKQFIKSLAIVALAINFAACSNETINEEALNETPLKSYTLSRAEDGTYSLEQTLANGEVTTSIVPLVNNEVKVDFETESSVKIPSLSIFDEPVTTKKGVSNKTKTDLKSYAITQLENGSFDLNFEVASFVVPTFSYSQEHGRYEIRLTEGDNNGIVNYSENYLKFEGEKLRIVFIHVSSETTLSKFNQGSEVVGPPIFDFD